MIPSSQNQILTYLWILLLSQCTSSASNSRVVGTANNTKLARVVKKEPLDDRVKKLKPSYFKAVNITSTSVTWYIDFDTMISRYPEIIKEGEFDDYNITVKVTYHILYSELSSYHATIFCKLNERVLMDHKPMIYEYQCINEMFAFRLFEQLDHSLDYLCTNFTTEFRREVGKVNAVSISNLLPSQTYAFTMETYLIANHSQLVPIDKEVDLVCLPDGPPKFPPQTDIASFTILPEVDDGDSLVDLYWRPLPRIVTGAREIRYEIYCETDDHSAMHNISVDHLYAGNVRIKKPPNLTYLCKVMAKNALGQAKGFGPIIVPDRDRLIDLGQNFRFFAYAVSNEEYYLEWTPIRFDAPSLHADVLPRNSTEEHLEGVFTIYWCIAGRAAGCSSLSGTMRTTAFSAYTLILPEKSELAPRVFGISYTHNSPKLSTGIIWAKCVANFAHQFIAEQIRISKVGPIESNHTALSIHWDFVGCDSQVAIIDFYQINYCKVSEITDCSVAWSSLKAEELGGYKFEETSERCRTVEHKNKFLKDAIVSELTSASRYIIRLRYVLGNGTANPWSEPKSAITLADPVLVSDCWSAFKWNFALVTLTIFVVVLVCCTKSKGWYLYCKLIKSRFKRTTGRICGFISNVTTDDHALEGAAIKYSATVRGNGLAGAHSELSLSFLASEEQARSTSPNRFIVDRDKRAATNEYNQVNHIFDYIPKNLIDGSMDNTTPENTSDSNHEVSKYENSSEQDEISVNSHPFVWDSNSNDEIDSNNNQIIK